MEEKKNETPLKELLVRSEEINERLLTDILKPYALIEESTGELIPTENFSNLQAEGKIIVVFLYSKAKFRLGFSSSEKLKPRDVENLVGLKGNTIRPILKRLKEANLIKADEEGYWLPNININRAKEFLTNLKVKK
jgi:DNA-binding transcriptional ArsR family regulator